jgi:hypothetical protein
MLVATYVESKKRPHTEDHVSVQTTMAAIPDDLRKGDESDAAAYSDCSRSDYPSVNFWTKEEWQRFESMKKDSSDPTDKPGRRGRTRCSQGENVTTRYIEDECGLPIDGGEAGQIRNHARSLWRDLYARQMAPQKWSDATRSVQDQYAREMEKKWPVLRLCADHWKVHYIATKNYPQWYKFYHKKMGKGKDTEPMGPPQKKHKPAVDSDDDDTGDCQTDPELDAVPSASDEDGSTAPPYRRNEDNHDGSSRDTSRPKARALRDPLYVLKRFVDSADSAPPSPVSIHSTNATECSAWWSTRQVVSHLHPLSTASAVSSEVLVILTIHITTPRPRARP